MGEQIKYREIDGLGFPGYRVGSDGSVWSRRKRGRGARSEDGWRQMKLTRIGSYCFVGLYPLPGRKSVTMRVHRLVLEAFVGPCPEGMQCCHADDCGTNNRLENLRWGTSKENHADLIRNRKQRARLTEAQVHEIRKRSTDGESGILLAKAFGVSCGAIYKVIHRQSWGHV